MERIIRDELMIRCGHMIDPRQHGFLKNKSCTTQLTDFCDSLALNILPFIQFHCTMSDKILDYVDSEKDLGIDIISKKIRKNSIFY